METPQTPQMKHYYKNKEKVLSYYKSYYEKNKEALKQKRRERYVIQKAEKARTQ